MELNQDFREFIASFLLHKVEFLLVGEEVELGGLRICTISREALIRNKRASGRLQDKADVARLERGGPTE